MSALAVAGWFLYCRGVSETGGRLPLNAPLSGRIAEVAGKTDGEDYVRQMFRLREVFGAGLPKDRVFCEAVRAAFADLQSGSVLKTLSAMIRLSCDQPDASCSH